MADDEKSTTESDGENDGTASSKVPAPPHHEDRSSTTSGVVSIEGSEIPYSATAGHLVLTAEEGKKEVSFFSVAYMRSDIEDVTSRPVVFCFNGGPGSSSVWLHLGAFGPRRVEMSEEGWPSAPPGRLVDNEWSILDVADLVFIDPVSTGLSRAIPEDDAKNYHHFKKDIESVGEFIRLWLTRNDRWQSPKFLAGESYGTLRSAALSGHLLKRHGMYLNGLILVSSILNYQTTGFDRTTWTFNRGNDLPYSLFLPTYAATAWYHGRLADDLQARSVREVVAEAEAFASGEYAQALFAGDRLTADERTAIVARVARYTGLSTEYVDESDLRIEILRFCKELLRHERRSVGRIDSRYTGHERFHTGDSIESDPSIDATMGLYASALNAYLRGELGYESDLPYEILTDRVHPWDYEDFKNAYVDTSETLRETMSRNPFMKVLVANGYFDLATPHFATEYTYSHLGLAPEIRRNISMTYYEAGHMMYVHLASLAALKRDISDFVADTLG